MKTKQTLLLVAASIAILKLNSSLGAEQISRSDAAGQNRALLVAPRTIEEFPALTRVAITGGKARQRSASTWNRALEASPRVQEEFPELARVQPSSIAKDKRAVLPHNRALLVAPRTLEEFPALSRGGLRMVGNVVTGATPNLAKVGR